MHTPTYQKTDIKSLLPAELRAYIVSLGEKAFRADQIFEWLHRHRAVSYEEMKNIPKTLRERLKAEAPLTAIEAVRVRVSQRDGTAKYLFRLPDGEHIESVLMRYDYGLSVCISSQAGCKMDCSFCATGKGGYIRDLTAAEMLEQVYSISRDKGEEISRIVVMGMGEPLDNYEVLLKFIRIICHEKGRGMSQRHITVSTCGIVPAIRALAQEKLQITLALSLHNAIDGERSGIMPVNRAYPVDEVLEAARYYFDTTGRRITFEYALIGGVNDSTRHARELIKAAKRVRAHINLIPVNPVVENTGFAPPAQQAILSFKNVLEKSGINVTIRREMGRDIDGACGQLRATVGDK